MYKTDCGIVNEKMQKRVFFKREATALGTSTDQIQPGLFSLQSEGNLYPKARKLACLSGTNRPKS
ncbi:hypothetical protein NADFUDRAFT_69331 [Nadsonia fulvescens var. elongata DSM 6958]|uniref:Uncharacterized protein n=1 Tax=Nadsonia fulvescens var. elongata DSM 6958 TaxID=857566 RepID=A0A1E3PQG9_9ASCO|nr:hypothetical protein NADFUDRAFT_69331 [Nadsonia fulvescens var. elongata DSM 6958]